MPAPLVHFEPTEPTEPTDTAEPLLTEPEPQRLDFYSAFTYGPGGRRTATAESMERVRMPDGAVDILTQIYGPNYRP
jgi:hypothetical protein